MPRMARMNSRMIHPIENKKGDKIPPGLSRVLHKENLDQVVLKKSHIEIVENVEEMEAGSLSNIYNQNNDFFSTRAFPQIGEYLTIKVLNHRGKNNDEKANEDAQDEELNQDELLKSIKSLEPPKLENSLIKEFKMKVVHIYQNGDLLLQYSRNSENENQINMINIKARVPAKAMLNEKPLTTKDLQNIQIVENVKNELVKRTSSSWDDEYTLRMSGFNEAQSKVASEVDSSMKKLKNMRSSFEKKLKTIQNERNMFAKNKQNSDSKLNELNQKIIEQKAKIDEQKQLLSQKDQELQALKPSEEGAENP